MHRQKRCAGTVEKESRYIILDGSAIIGRSGFTFHQKGRNDKDETNRLGNRNAFLRKNNAVQRGQKHGAEHIEQRKQRYIANGKALDGRIADAERGSGEGKGQKSGKRCKARHLSANKDIGNHDNRLEQIHEKGEEHRRSQVISLRLLILRLEDKL